MLRDPGMVGGALQGEVERDLETVLTGRGDERVEVLDRAEAGVDRVVPAVRRPDRPRAAGVAGLRREGVVAPLPVRRTDGVDRWQIDDVEAHPRDCGKPLRRGTEGARFRRRGAVADLRALGAGEELVPRGERGA